MRSSPGLYLLDVAGVTHEVPGAAQTPEGEVEELAHGLAEALGVPLTWL